MVGVCNPLEYLSAEVFVSIKAKAESVETPAVIVHTGMIVDSYKEMKSLFPDAKIYYAMKANPAEQVCAALANAGSHFDIASIYEMDRLLELGVDASRLSFGNTVKKSKDVRYAFTKGVRLFASDSENDIRNCAKAAPGSKIYVRIITEGSESADWPLSRKFGCHPDMAMELLILAKKVGLIPYGISFHVGSQQRDIDTWDATLAKVKVIFARLKAEANIQLRMINMGGGFPANYLTKTNPLKTYAAEINRFLAENFGNEKLDIILEPGRSLVANAGVLVTEVIMIARKSRFALNRWVYLDAGKFNGFIETLDEAIKYPIWVARQAEEEDVILAGPTCDSVDIIYEEFKYKLPLNLAEGDRLYFFTAGAYTASYASVEFNGFPPLIQYNI